MALFSDTGISTMSDKSSLGGFAATKSETSKLSAQPNSSVPFNSEAQANKQVVNSGEKAISKGVKHAKPKPQPQATYELTPFGMKRSISHAGAQQPYERALKEPPHTSKRLEFLKSLDKTSVRSANQSKEKALTNVATHNFGR